MPQISYTVTGDRRVELKLEEFPKSVHDRLLDRITGLTRELEARVQAAEPDKTGKLRRDTASRIFDDQDKITGRVTIEADFAKAAALEYGAHRAAKVSAHLMRLDHVFARLIAPMTVLVQMHRRTPNITEHRFLRGTLAQMAPEIQAQLEAAVAEAAAESE